MPLTKRILEAKKVLLLALIYTLAITFVFFVPGKDLPHPDLVQIDKIVHGFIYFFLMNLWMLFWYVKKKSHITLQNGLILLLCLLLYGIIIEILQGLFTDSRSADIMDIVANVIGSLLGILFFEKIKSYIKPLIF